MDEESKAEGGNHNTESHTSSEEETKMVGSGQAKFNETISSSSSEWAPLCQRWSSEDANLVCTNWGNVFLWASWDDLIHSLGVFENHKRVGVEEFEPQDKEENSNINAEIEITMDTEKPTVPLSQEAQSVVDIYQSKLYSFESKSREWDLLETALGNKEKEIKMNLQISEENINKSMKYLRLIIDNKEKQLKSELKDFEKDKNKYLETSKNKTWNLK